MIVGTSEFPILVLFPLTCCFIVPCRTGPIINYQLLCCYIANLTAWPKIASQGGSFLMECSKRFEMATFQFLYNT